jgi:hypothetical protein
MFLQSKAESDNQRIVKVMKMKLDFFREAMDLSERVAQRPDTSPHDVIDTLKYASAFFFHFSFSVYYIREAARVVVEELDPSHDDTNNQVVLSSSQPSTRNRSTKKK